MSTPGEPSEQELAEMRAAYEAQMKQIKAADVIVQSAVSLINLAGRRLGLSEDTRDERDLEQARDAIDAVRGLMPVLERCAGPDLRALRDAVGNLQMAYAREVQGGQDAPAPAGQAAAATAATSVAGVAESGAEPAQPGGTPAPDGPAERGEQGGEAAEGRRPGPAESSGRLWVPGR